MNTYNDNLRSLVFRAMQERDQNKKKLNAQLSAAKISLYYAQGERIGAEEKLTLAKEELKLKREIKNQAVENTNLGNNIQASAEQQKKYSAQATTNMTTCATNVQMASKSILKLAGSVGSIYSIINAADYGADLYNTAASVKQLVDKTAYEAERCSELAMDAAAQVAEIPINKMESQAKLTDSSLKEMLKVADAEYDQIAAAVTADNNTLATDRNQEKTTQGKLEDIYVDQLAAVDAYAFMNQELNLNLSVDVPNPNLLQDTFSGLAPPLSEAFSPNSFTVNFNSILSPFQGEENPSNYPVSKYHVLLVKNSKRNTFSIEDAEAAIAEKSTKTKVYSLPVSIPNDYDAKEGESIPLSVSADCKTLYDTDKEKIAFGQNYVVFVLAEYDNAYKRTINDFENFLSVPSNEFCLTTQLASPNASSIKVNDNVLSFTTTKDTNGTNNVEYRCMFLPASTANLALASLTEKALNMNTYSLTYEKDVEQSENQVKELEEKLSAAKEALEAAVKQAGQGLNQKHTEQRIKRLQLKKRLSSKDKSDLKELQAHLKNVVAWNDELENAQKNYDRLNQLSQQAEDKLSGLTHDQLSFYFDLALAEQVSESNYYIAELNSKKSENQQDWQLDLNATITDNFGVPLIQGEKYLPVILTAAKAEVGGEAQFTNALSNYEETAVFTYHPNVNQ